jgi:hypothetical protein
LILTIALNGGFSIKDVAVDSAYDWKGFLEAMAAGAAGGAILLSVVVWFLRDKFFNWVEACFDSRGPAMKDKIDKLYKEDISRQEQWVDEVRRNQHSIEGLTNIMSRHESELQAMREVPSLVRQSLATMERMEDKIDGNTKITNDHAVQLGRLIERRNTQRED